jgi:SAM-dependent methyltransferase
MDRDDWNRRYAERELVWTAEPNRFLVAETTDLDPATALDLAAGEGRNAVWLAARGWRVTAIDFAEAGLAKGRRLAAERGVEVDWTLADLTDWTPADTRWDLVVVLYLHLPARPLARVLERAAAAVAPGGTFLLVGHDRTNLERGHGGPQDPAVLYGPDDVVASLAGLTVIRAERRQRPVETDDGVVEAVDCVVRAMRPRKEERPS